MDDFIDFPRRLGEEFFDRLTTTPDALAAVPTDYREVRIPKRSGGYRDLSIPNPELLSVQRRLNKSILRRLPKSAHAMGFVPFRSIAKHAARHASRRCVVRLDITDFFGTTSIERLRNTFHDYGWSDEVIEAVTRICSHPSKQGLPQGAATSPTLSNVVNLELDRRLAGLAKRFFGRYSRYADDITFSFSLPFHRTQGPVGSLLRCTRSILNDYGYVLNDQKTAIMGDSTRQMVTGLVVNDKASLPREVRRRIRAAEHRQSLSRQMVQVTGARPAPPMTSEQLRGWQSFRSMAESVQFPTGWISLQNATPKERFLHARELTWAISCLDGLPFRSRSGGECLNDTVVKTGSWSRPRVKALLNRARSTDVVRSRFLEALAAVDRDIQQWRTRTLGPVEGLVAMAGASRGLVAVGVDREGAAEVIGVEPDADVTDTLHWRNFFQSLYMRGVTGVGWVTCDTTGALDAWRSVWSAWRQASAFFKYVDHSCVTESGIAPVSLLRFLPNLSEHADPRHRRIAWTDLISMPIPRAEERRETPAQQPGPPACELRVHSVGHNFWSVLSLALLRRVQREAGLSILLRFERTSRHGELAGYAVPFAAIYEGLHNKNLSQFFCPSIDVDDLHPLYHEKHRWQIRIVKDVLSVVKDKQDVWSCPVGHFRFGDHGKTAS